LRPSRRTANERINRATGFKVAVQIQTVLRLASPHFPRRHGDPDDYLRRTVARAAFFPPQAALCARIVIQPLRHA
jgi:hypothetical protein